MNAKIRKEIREIYILTDRIPSVKEKKKKKKKKKKEKTKKKTNFFFSHSTFKFAFFTSRIFPWSTDITNL